MTETIGDTSYGVPLDAAVSLLGQADAPTVERGSRPLLAKIAGVELHLVRAHLDQRGMLAEVINFDEPFWREPIVYCYSISVNPGRVRGWGMHLRQVDRHFVHSGTVRFALYDSRVGSPSEGVVQVLCLGDEARGAVRIPAGVWHAVQNVGNGPAHISNYPTIPYDHARPDKQMLPFDTDQIPFDFGRLDDFSR